MIWTFKQMFCRKGQTLHMISGISHRCTKAAWTLKGVQRADVIISVKVKKKYVRMRCFLIPARDFCENPIYPLGQNLGNFCPEMALSYYFK